MDIIEDCSYWHNSGKSPFTVYCVPAYPTNQTSRFNPSNFNSNYLTITSLIARALFTLAASAQAAIFPSPTALHS